MSKVVINKISNSNRVIKRSSYIIKPSNINNPNGLVNMYKIIDKKYLLIQLTNNYATLCDIEHLDFVEKNVLCAVRIENNIMCAFFPAGSNDNKLELFDMYITGYKYDYVEHANRCFLDNRTHNLRDPKTIEHVTLHSDPIDPLACNKCDTDNTKHILKMMNKNVFPTCELESRLEYEKIMSKYSNGYKWK